MNDTTSAAPSLLPCPFCGSKAVASINKSESLWSHDIVDWTRVHCTNDDCNAQTEPTCDGYEPSAVEVWNRRVPAVTPSDAEIDAQWRESVAKHETTAAFVRDFARAVLAKWGAPKQEAQEPATIDKKTMELAESVGLIGPASRIGDLHAAIQRFHDLICVNATIKAAVMAADVISGVATPARDYPPLPMQFACSGVFPVYSADQMRAYVDADRAAYAPASSQPAPAPLSDDTERLEWLLWKLPGDALRYVVGELADTSSGSEFRAAIDAALAAQGGK